MARQTILWTVLPNGRVEDGEFAGQLRVSLVASPRLTPEASDEQVLKAFPEWRNWPKTLDNVKFSLQVGPDELELRRISDPDADLWAKLFSAQTPVSGYVFKDMSKVNLRSFPMRNVLGTLRMHYKNLAIQSTGTPPTLLPWSQAHPGLKDLLGELGTRTEKINLGDRQIEYLVPGFNRFFDDEGREGTENRLRNTVFGTKSIYRGQVVGVDVDEQGNPRSSGQFPVRALPPDWHNPAGGGADASIMGQFSSAAEYAFYQADRFYRREPLTQAKLDKLDAQKQLRRPKLVDVPAPPKAPDFDFHRIVASYSDYPRLLRRLGLVIDCVVQPNSPIDLALNAAPQVQGRMSLNLSWGSAHDPADDSCPQTAWIADKYRFVTRPRTQDHERGLLKLQYADDKWNNDKRTLFDVYQVDPDGAALKTVDFVITAQNLVGKSLAIGADGAVTYTTGDKQAVAALRTGGLGISRHGKALTIAQSAASAALKDAAVKSGAGKKVVLFTEDLLRGYRVDVQPVIGGSPEKWHTLCGRHGTYKLIATNEDLPLEDDEGYVKGASTTSSASEDADPDDHYLHESMFRWTGWSLVTQRPGKTLRASSDPTSGVQSETPETVADEATIGGNGVSATFVAAKGSLPRLRFGTQYRFRARLVDLAGNSLGVDDRSLEDDEQVSEPVGYLRFEPVDPPVLVQRARVSEGESLERMVIRSNFDVDPEGYLKKKPFKDAIKLPASQDFDYTAGNERHVVPPKSSQLQCEQHGLFDVYFADPASIKTAYAIASREAGSLNDPTATSTPELITPAAIAGTATRTILPLRLPSPDNPTGDRLAAGQYVIHRGAQVSTPYLPDGASGGFALRAMQGHSIPGVTVPVVLGPSAAVVRAPNQELVLVVAHGKEWPDSTGFRIVLQERGASLLDPPCDETFNDGGTPAWDEDKRVLTIFIAKGRIACLRYASFAHKKFMDSFGLPGWIDTAGERDFLRGMAELGCAWMMTPYRELTLVHATQQPVCAPEMIKLVAGRSMNDQFAILRAQVRLHGPSTGKFEVEAHWKEWIDDLEKPGPELVDSHGALGEILLAENHENTFDLNGAVNAQQYDAARPRARGDRHEFGDTKFRLVEYKVCATTRFREYLPPSIYEQKDQVTRLGPIAEGQQFQLGADDDPGAPFLVQPGAAPLTIVKSSAAPDEPRIVYVMPTFRWEETADNSSLDTVRLGNGLRVWLERPWFSSGNGELLGVVILQDNARFTDIPVPVVPLVTQWGLDPLWDTSLPKNAIRITDFPSRVINEAVPLLEPQAAGQQVQIIGHRVHWDQARSLWYCDIELNPGSSYMPFVRLALVRYQPNALSGAKISKVVLADFSQVLPRRRSSFQRDGAVVAVKLRGTVPSHGPMKFPTDSEYQDISFIPLPGQAVETGRNKVELVLQTRDPAIDSDLAWIDQKVLTSAILAPVAGIGPIVTTTLFDQPAVRVEAPPAAADRLGQRISLDLTHIASPIDVVQIPPDLFDPVIWSANVTLPDTAGKPARLAIREYERYYTDRTIAEQRGGATRRRKVVEERLVYTVFFDLQ
ncbi:hypothetical protein SAMN04515648_4347 [Phyllobacterium sp. CL33Tsu]|uniref:hypothetical protein n=1 Tax=Phyllobacterium sp. CL33Tsu TaxID=1798191 RepID=UPI0008EE7EDC|nr:hypothetical protein [Phyllobacterium sp. CL33Tsu]SFJ50407.1 hypothetical protein SAMN04515648_4347 [Phyllobacterium sp. CL33Tsu]